MKNQKKSVDNYENVIPYFISPKCIKYICY